MAESFPVIFGQSVGPAPTELMVFGERNSGTNLAHALLQRNIPAFADAPGDRIGRFGFRYGWKHGFPMMLSAPDHVLCLCVFRHPEPWLRSMHARPWHVAPHLRALPFDAFIRAEWHTVVDERNFGLDPDDPRAVQELHWDRDPLTGKRFENILALRTAKTAAFLTLPARFANCLLLRHEDIVGDPERFVAHVAEAYGLPRHPVFHPVAENRGRPEEGRFSPREYAPLSPKERVFVWANLDAAQEQILGFEPSGD